MPTPDPAPEHRPDPAPPDGPPPEDTTAPPPGRTLQGLGPAEIARRRPPGRDELIAHFRRLLSRLKVEEAERLARERESPRPPDNTAPAGG